MWIRLFSIFFCILSTTLSAQITSFDWLGITKGLSPTRVRTIHIDNDENVITMGTFNGNISYENPNGATSSTISGDNNLYVQKVDVDGNFLWLVDMASSGGHSAEDIITDVDGNIYISGVFSDNVSFENEISSINSNGAFDGFIVKYSPEGQPIWAFPIGGLNDDGIESMTMDQAGNIIVLGFYNDLMDVDPSEGEWLLESEGQRQSFVASYNPNGQLNWAKQLTDFTSDFSTPIDAKINSNNELIVIGSFFNSIGFITENGVEELQSSGAGDIGYVLKLDLDTEGTFVWAKAIGQSPFGWISLNSVQIAANDDIIIEAPISGEVIIEADSISESFSTNFRHSVIIRLANEDGAMQWIQAFAGTGDAMVFDIALDEEGNIYAVGIFAGQADFDVLADNGNELISSQPNDEKEHFLAVLSKDGDLLNTYQYGKETFFGFGSKIEIKGEAIYITGIFEQNVDLNPLPNETLFTSTAGTSDTYLIKLRRDPITHQPILNDRNGLTVFPNPTPGIIVIDDVKEPLSYRLYDMNGKLCQVGKINNTENQMNLSKLENGVYLLYLENNQVFSIIKK